LTRKEHRLWRDRLFDRAHYLELPVNKAQFETVMTKLEESIVHRAYKIIENVPQAPL
jgi:hypothetical protein